MEWWGSIVCWTGSAAPGSVNRKFQRQASASPFYYLNRMAVNCRRGAGVGQLKVQQSVAPRRFRLTLLSCGQVSRLGGNTNADDAFSVPAGAARRACSRRPERGNGPADRRPGNRRGPPSLHARRDAALLRIHSRCGKGQGLHAAQARATQSCLPDCHARRRAETPRRVETEVPAAARDSRASSSSSSRLTRGAGAPQPVGPCHLVRKRRRRHRFQITASP